MTTWRPLAPWRFVPGILEVSFPWRPWRFSRIDMGVAAMPPWRFTRVNPWSDLGLAVLARPAAQILVYVDAAEDVSLALGSAP